jgi:hypothetical protein
MRVTTADENEVPAVGRTSRLHSLGSPLPATAASALSGFLLRRRLRFLPGSSLVLEGPVVLAPLASPPDVVAVRLSSR